MLEVNKTKEEKLTNVAESKSTGKRPEYKAENMSLEGALKLVEKMLIQTYNEYVDALKKVKYYSEKRSLTVSERRRFITALRSKEECESFYRSKRFKIFTLGKGMDGEEVIETIKKRNGFLPMNKSN